MGRTFEPIESGGLVTAEMRAAEQVDRLIRRLASLNDGDAALALDALVDNEALSMWRVLLERVRDQQRVIHQDPSYQHPDLEQVRKPESTEAMGRGVDTRDDGQGKANGASPIPIDGDEGGVR